MLQSKLLFMHSIHNSYAPNSFKNMFIKNNDRDEATNSGTKGPTLYQLYGLSFSKSFLFILFLEPGRMQAP